MSTYEEAYELDFFNSCLDKLAKDIFYSDIGSEQRIKIPQKELEKSAWIASVLSSSDNEEHQKKALAFATLLVLYTDNEEERRLYEKYFRSS